MSQGSTNKQYPTGIDSFATWEDDIDNILAHIVNDVQEQVIAIETELGSDPAGSVADVKTRLAVELNNDGTFKNIRRKTVSVTAANGEYAFDFTTEGLTDYADTNYRVQLTPVGGSSVSPWAVVKPSTKATAGFTILLQQSGLNGSAPYNASVAGAISVEVVTIHD